VGVAHLPLQCVASCRNSSASPRRPGAPRGPACFVSFLVELGAPMIVASTMVPLPTFSPLACSPSPIFANRAAPRSCFSSKCRNFGSGVRSGTRSRPQVDAHEATQRRAVQQRILAGLVGQIESVLHDVHAQHALQPDRWTNVARVWAVPLDHLAQCLPRNDLLHRLQESIGSPRPARPLVLRVLVGRHCQGLPINDFCIAGAIPGSNLISVALVVFTVLPQSSKGGIGQVRIFRGLSPRHFSGLF